MCRVASEEKEATATRRAEADAIVIAAIIALSIDRLINCTTMDTQVCRVNIEFTVNASTVGQ